MTLFSSRTPRLTPNRIADALATARAAGRPIIDLTSSNPTRAEFDYPPDLLAPLADPAAHRYDPQPLGAWDARRVVSDDYRRHGLDVPPAHIVLTASTSEAYSLVFKLLCDAGDEVLAPRPSYPLFDHLTQLDLVDARPYDLEYHGVWSIDFPSVERAIGPRTRAVLIVSPNNPTGSFVTAAEFDRLCAICRARGVAIVADEVFADYELEPGTRAGAGRALTCGDVLSFSLGGLSKSVGLPQVKLGWMALAGPDALVSDALERLEVICDAYLSVSTPVQIAAPRLLTSGRVVREQIVDRIAANYQWLKTSVTAVPSCGVLRADAGWSAVLQVPTLEPEDDLVVRLLTTDGVLVHPGHFFDFPRESVLVVSLLTPPSVFADGISRVLRHFACSPANA